MLSCNSTKCHCPACNARRAEIAKIADDRIANERAQCNVTGERFGHHALRNAKHGENVNLQIGKSFDSAAASWTKRRESETAAKLVTVRELCRRVCVNANLGKSAAQDILAAHGAMNVSQLSTTHYDAVIRTYETMLADVTVTDTDAERDARRARVLSPEPSRFSQHVEERGKHVYYSKVSYYDHDHNRIFKWKWRRGIGWMKVAKSGLVFGDRYRKVVFTGLGYNAWHYGAKIGRPDEVYRDDEHGIVRVGPDIIGHSARITAVEHTETKTVGNLSHTVTDRVETLPCGDVCGWQHQYQRDANGNIKWLQSRWKDIDGPVKVVETRPVRKWHGIDTPNFGGLLDDQVRQAMSATPIWAGAITGRWEARKKVTIEAAEKAYREKYAATMVFGEFSEENLRAAFLGGGAKTGPDAENDPINLGGTMISALKLSILFWRKAHHYSWRYPMKPDRDPGLVRNTLIQLEREQLVKFGAEDLEYSLTPRAEVLLDAIQNLPLPTQPEPVWVMPKA